MLDSVERTDIVFGEGGGDSVGFGASYHSRSSAELKSMNHTCKKNKSP